MEDWKILKTLLSINIPEYPEIRIPVLEDFKEISMIGNNEKVPQMKSNYITVPNNLLIKAKKIKILPPELIHVIYSLLFPSTILVNVQIIDDLPPTLIFSNNLYNYNFHLKNDKIEISKLLNEIWRTLNTKLLQSKKEELGKLQKDESEQYHLFQQNDDLGLALAIMSQNEDNVNKIKEYSSYYKRNALFLKEKILTIENEIQNLSDFKSYLVREKGLNIYSKEFNGIFVN